MMSDDEDKSEQVAKSRSNDIGVDLEMGEIGENDSVANSGNGNHGTLPNLEGQGDLNLNDNSISKEWAFNARKRYKKKNVI
ncbi:hypothetical protein Hanom_Chr17g01552241 [Helianthus anomalus]